MFIIMSQFQRGKTNTKIIEIVPFKNLFSQPNKLASTRTKGVTEMTVFKSQLCLVPDCIGSLKLCSHCKVSGAVS